MVIANQAQGLVQRRDMGQVALETPGKNDPGRIRVHRHIRDQAEGLAPVTTAATDDLFLRLARHRVDGDFLGTKGGTDHDRLARGRGRKRDTGHGELNEQPCQRRQQQPGSKENASFQEVLSQKFRDNIRRVVDQVQALHATGTGQLDAGHEDRIFLRFLITA